MGVIYGGQARRLEICNMKINKARGLNLKSFCKTHTYASGEFITQSPDPGPKNFLLLQPETPSRPTMFSVDLENYSHFMALIMRSRVAHVAARLFLLLVVACCFCCCCC